MSLSSIDSKIVSYLPQLGVNEKKSILEVIKSFVKLKGNEKPVSLLEYNNEIEEAMILMENGELYEHEEAKKIASTW